MGSKELYSGIVGLVDIARLLVAFERANECAITVTLSPVTRGNGSDLIIQLSAFTRPIADAEPARLAYVDFYRSASNFLTLESAIISGLYQLDAKLEYERAPERDGK